MRYCGLSFARYTEDNKMVRIGNCDIPNLSDIVESTFDGVMHPDFMDGGGVEFDAYDVDDFDDSFDDGFDEDID